MLITLLLTHSASASTREFLTPGSQPLESPSALRQALSQVCGSLLDTTTELDERLDTFEACDVVLRPTGFEVRWFLDRAPARAEPLADAAVTTVQEDDLDLLVTLGFDELEFFNIVTTDVGARDLTEGQTRSDVRYVASKTFVDRAFLGIELAGSRVVVTRDAGGALLGVNATWPVVEAGALLDVTSDDIRTVGEAPLGLAEGELRAVRRVIIPELDEGGFIRSGRVYTELLYAYALNETKVLSRYLFDGSIVNPLHR